MWTYKVNLLEWHLLCRNLTRGIELLISGDKMNSNNKYESKLIRAALLGILFAIIVFTIPWIPWIPLKVKYWLALPLNALLLYYAFRIAFTKRTS